MRGNQTLRTHGSATITGTHVTLLGGPSVFNFTGVGGVGTTADAFNQSANGQELIADGTIDLWFGQKAPTNREDNFVRTVPGKGWFAYFRLYGPLEPWFESGTEPVLATTSETEPSAFVRVMLLPREWEGRRTISYVDPADAETPKTQRATVYFDEPVEP